MNRLRTGVAGAYLTLCVLLGGASAAGALANALLQLVALLLIVLHVWSRGAPPLPREGRWLLFLFLGFAAVAAAQLIPLPASVWTDLPGRDVITRSLRLLGLSPGDMPASLDPRRTQASLLWFLPPAAMYLVTTRLTRDERSVLAKVLLGLALLSFLVGAFQLLGGGGSRLFFYEITNPGRTVGFFANANHLATLLLAGLPFTALFIARTRKERSTSGGRHGSMFIYAAVAGFLSIALVLNGSLAGYGLLFPTAAASFLLYKKSAGKALGRRPWWALAIGVLFIGGLAAIGPLPSERVAQELKDESSNARKISVPTTLKAAADHFPLGSGLGTFRDVYRTYESTENITFVYVNHAHNDYAEIALELGLPGLLIVLAFFAWWALRTFQVWRGDFNGAALARAGSIVIGVVLAHSLVDYPLRTSAMAAVAAMAAGFMIQPPVASRRSQGGKRGHGRPSARHIDADAVTDGGPSEARE